MNEAKKNRVSKAEKKWKFRSKIQGKAEPAPSLTHGLPPTPRERRAARRKAALAEADKAWADRRERARPKAE